MDVVIGSRDFDDDESFRTGLSERKLGPATPYVICAAPAYFADRPMTTAKTEITVVVALA
ncbi:hypothetical protein SAMN02927900_01530 [Rhizobium mongolense subsp. loessense]|uniref:Uncharacterized protein n=1 Tax=Rhizobium mongolense subsp. loessense TaxID=158890 RepID=A0A1G4QA75_9HYPH|nr:hypothetical protein SAMN02927900_01530 [Rhizobium mongolense subsp. loessense]